MSDDNLTKDDLMLLMESYRNMITMHKTILDQSTKTIEKLENITSKQDAISTKQTSVCTSLSKITDKLDDVIGGSNKTVEKMEKHAEKSVDTHNKIISKVHVGWIGMGTIILGLIGLVVTIIKTAP
jgi:cysteinyl-tRNA synthetase